MNSKQSDFLFYKNGKENPKMIIPPELEIDLEPPTLADVYTARKIIYKHIKPSPLLQSTALSRLVGTDVYVKCENLLPTGAFKVRGGLNLVSQLPEAERKRGVITA